MATNIYKLVPVKKRMGFLDNINKHLQQHGLVVEGVKCRDFSFEIDFILKRGLELVVLIPYTYMDPKRRNFKFESEVSVVCCGKAVSFNNLSEAFDTVTEYMVWNMTC